MKRINKYLYISLGMILIQTIFYQIGKVFSANEAFLIHSSLDDKIPYLSFFIIFYIIWYFLLVLFPLFIVRHSEDKFYQYNLCILINAVVSLMVFLLFPTQIPRYVITGNGIFDSIVKAIYYFDTPTVCLPSLHASVCFIVIYFCIFTKEMPNKYRVLFSMLSVLIILSTLFVKQHVVYDVALSFIITLIVYFIVSKFNLKEIFKKCFTF